MKSRFLYRGIVLASMLITFVALYISSQASTYWAYQPKLPKALSK